MNKVLIVGPSWVGDMVMAQSLFRLLRTRRPEAFLDVLAPAWSLPVIARMPEIRKGVESPAGHGEVALPKRWRVAKRLRAEGYRQAIVLPRSFKAALIPWLAGIPRRTGFRGEMRAGLINDVHDFDERRLDQTVKRFLALGINAGEPLPSIPQPQLRVSAENQRRLVDRLDLDTGKPVIAMMPGAEYGPAKCWPLNYYRELAAVLAAADYAVWVMGSARDAEAGESIARDGGAANLCGKTELVDVIDLLGLCRQAVSNDSGLMHIAAAVGTRVIALYGSTSPGFTPPLTENRVLHYLALECSPCFQRECPLGHLRCLREITPHSVFDSIRSG
ncbi:MAG TPA: lipopolysaccharide heptosyltransferase II [Burkholderiales bacterium]|nr:lipopolysaccharide heptosyltransferase II [Burkholderiales bacterium]